MFPLPVPPAAAPPQSAQSGPSSRRWAVSGQCPRGSWWCTPLSRGCCRSCYRPPGRLSRCASPPPAGSAWARHPGASPCARRCKHPGRSTEGSAAGWPPSQSPPGTVEKGVREVRIHKMGHSVGVTRHSISSTAWSVASNQNGLTLDRSIGRAMMKCSVSLFLSSIWVFLSFAVKTCKYILNWASAEYKNCQNKVKKTHPIYLANWNIIFS